MSPYPRYAYPGRTLFGLAGQMLTGGLRSFRADGRACIGRLNPPLRIAGERHIPAAGPALVTVNHYHNPGFNAWWIALAIAAVVPAEMHWAITSELTYPGKWYAPLGQAGSRWLLRRLAAVYGFTTMPPMPSRPDDVTARVLAVQRILRYARTHPDAILGLAPEGMDMPGGVLSWPPGGAGRFIALLVGLGFPITPAAAYEQDGAFHLGFGPAYVLQLPPGLSAAERDQRAARIVMTAIAHLLPPHLRGDFA